MGSILPTLGIGGGPGAQGLSYQAGSAPLATPVTSDQATQAYQQAQTGIQNQASFLSALQGQNGIGNQSSVYNQLQGVANGTGPNPAMAALNQATSANTANQAALMAGQRGAGANVGLMARQAAQQGGANQQAAAGQGATMQAQQSLGALNQLGGLATQQVGQQAAATSALTGAQQSEQQTLLNAIAQQNNANVAQQSNQNNVNSQMAQAGAKTQGSMLSGAGMALGMAKGGQVPQYYPNGGPVNSNYNAQAAQALGSAPTVTLAPPVSSQAAAASATPQQNGGGSSKISNTSGADAFEQNGQNEGKMIGQGINALAGGIASLFGANSSSDPTDMSGFQGGQSAGDMLGANNPEMQGGDPTLFDSGSGATEPALSGYGSAASSPGLDMSSMQFAKGGKVPAMVSPGERYLSPKEVDKVAQGKKKAAQAGKEIQGKAKVPGDSLKNDVVPKTLETGGVVLPRSVNKAPDRDAKAEAFVNAILHKHGLISKKK